MGRKNMANRRMRRRMFLDMKKGLTDKNKQFLFSARLRVFFAYLRVIKMLRGENAEKARRATEKAMNVIASIK